MADMASRVPEFTYDPADMPTLRARLRHLPESETFPDFELTRAEIGEDALLRLPEILQELAGRPGPVVVVQDGMEYVRGGESVKPLVAQMLTDAGWAVETVVVPDAEDGKPHADAETVDLVLGHLRPGVPVVSVGSGTVTDVAKHACFLFGQEQEPLPLVFCATANSMLAYSAQMAVILRDGVKRTWPSRLSDALIHDTQVLRDAPAHTVLAGIGDITPIYVSFGDWYLAYRFGLGSFKQASVEFLVDVREKLLPYAGEMGRRTPVGIDVLSRLLTLSGITATIAGETAPLSGYEHVIGHVLDMAAEHYQRPVGSHGSQVGMAVPLASISWNILLDELVPEDVDVDACYPSFATMEARVRETFDRIDPSGRMAAECWSDYSSKLEGWHAARPAFESFLAAWDVERARLRSLVPPAQECIEAVVTAGLPTRFEDLPVPIPEDQARWAFGSAHLMRNRLSHVDLLHFLGWLDESFVDRVFSRLRELADARPKQRSAPGVRAIG
jgi:glycerol-1-phosphate dehydrogenase [NAD(P)+]